MTKKILGAAIASACTLALAAGPAHAASHSTLAFTLTPDFALPVSCSDRTLYGFGLDVASLSGRPLGTGQTCITSDVGCDPLVAYCRRSVRSALTLDLARGSLTMPLRLLEVWPTESSFVQAGRGTVRSGTGAYAGVTGLVAGGGHGEFDEQGAFSGRLVYVAELKGGKR